VPSEYAPLRRDPLTVTVAGTRIHLPYQPAAVWAQGMDHPGTLASILADAEDREVLADLVIDLPGARQDLEAESLRILEESSGRRWWEAGRLISTSVSPEVLGRMVLAGVDPWARSVGEWCAAVYALCVKGQDEKGRIRFDFSLSVPPPGYEDAWDDEGGDPAAAEAFLASLKR
jgi:hypothetical protein